MEISLIFAQGTNGAFGLDNGMPWRAPTDLAYFSQMTKGHAVVMGKNTWFSLPPSHRPLKDRLNIVVSNSLKAATVPHNHTLDPSPSEVSKLHYVRSLYQAIAHARSQNHTDLFVIGGPSLLMEARMQANVILQTLVDYEGPFDVKAPEVIDKNDWRLESCTPTSNSFVKAPRDEVGVRFLVWRRKKRGIMCL